MRTAGISNSTSTVCTRAAGGAGRNEEYSLYALRIALFTRWRTTSGSRGRMASRHEERRRGGDGAASRLELAESSRA